MTSCTTSLPHSDLSSPSQTVRLAHTAHCKLQLAADRPDRDLRFILGHAFTLDKLRLRVVEIETDSTSEEDEEDEVHGKGIRFKGAKGLNTEKRRGKPSRRSPPPPVMEPVNDVSDEDERDEDEDDENSRDSMHVEDDENGDGMALRRFGSATANPPRKVEDSSEEELSNIIQGEESQQLKVGLDGIAKCRCHGQHAPIVERVWEIPHDGGLLGREGKRMALVQVAA